jgi:hypothetical protein
MIDSMQALIDHYQVAKSWISSSVYLQEVRWQESRSLENLSEPEFLREYAWVVLNSGFRESVVRRCFDFISLCFCDWESAEAIACRRSVCVEAAFPIFKNRRKLEAIASTAAMIYREGFERLTYGLQTNPTTALRSLPYIGEVTSWHLAKNLGADVAKPDRHMVRLAERFGYKDTLTMCKDISMIVGDRISVADLVLWRFEERTFAY